MKIVQNAPFRARRVTMAATKITVHIDGYVGYPKVPRSKADRSEPCAGPCFRGTSLPGATAGRPPACHRGQGSDLIFDHPYNAGTLERS